MLLRRESDSWSMGSETNNMQRPLIRTYFAREECNTWDLSGFPEWVGVYSEGVHSSFGLCFLFSSAFLLFLAPFFLPLAI